LSTSLTPFIKWGDYKSQDQNKPDVLEIQVSEVDTFETAYSINVQVLQKDDGTWTEKILPLKSFESKNGILLQEWQKHKSKLKSGKKFLLKTWLDKSKTSNHKIRRFVLDF